MAANALLAKPSVQRAFFTTSRRPQVAARGARVAHISMQLSQDELKKQVRAWAGGKWRRPRPGALVRRPAREGVST